MSALTIAELEYLAIKNRPIWGGTIGADGKTRDTDLKHAESEGLIRQVGLEGFEITPAGRKFIADNAPSKCPTCGAIKP